MSERAETDLTALLATLSPELQTGSYVYAVVTNEVPLGSHPVVLVREHEGITLVLPRDEADRLGLPYDFVAAWITLRVHSSLEAVGLTAAVSGALAVAGIAANVVAGYHHDHVFVPIGRAEAAMAALRALAG